MDNFDQLLIDLGRAMVDLFLIMRGQAHGIFQGSHQAALFEAQGGQIGPGGFDHLDDVRRTAAAIESRQDLVNLALNRLNGLDFALGGRLRAICDPILRQSSEFIEAAEQTEQAAVSLRATDPTRFQGVILGQGGLGPEIGRTARSLPVNQLNQMSAQLAARGIDSRLIPAARSSLQSVLVRINQLPIDAKEALSKLGLTISAMRALLATAGRQALLAGRFALAAALTAIEEALVTIGSRLTVPVFIIPDSLLKQIKRDAGLPDDTTA